MAVFGLTVKPGDQPTAPFDLDAGEFPATFRITMAAIDPTAKPALDGAANGETLPRATLKMIRLPYDGDSEMTTMTNHSTWRICSMTRPRRVIRMAR